MLTVIEDADEIKRCQVKLQKAFQRVSQKPREWRVGFPSGSALAEVYYSESLKLWMTFKPIDNRYWNCAGLGDPFDEKAPAPHLEINPPLEGIDRRMAGAFLEDEDGTRYLGHSGKVGGGKKGVSKTNFLAYYPAYAWVLSGDRQVPMYVIGNLDDVNLPSALRDFTQVSAEFRGRFSREDARNDVEKDDLDGAFNPEFEGTKAYASAKLVEAACTHGLVVRKLRNALEQKRVDAFNSLQRDLYVPGKNGVARVLFEVKSDSTSTSVYTAIGQLLFHGGAKRAQHLVAVLPTTTAQSVLDRLEELSINVLLYSLSGTSVKFDGLDTLLRRVLGK